MVCPVQWPQQDSLDSSILFGDLEDMDRYCTMHLDIIIFKKSQLTSEKDIYILKYGIFCPDDRKRKQDNKSFKLQKMNVLYRQEWEWLLIGLSQWACKKIVIVNDKTEENFRPGLGTKGRGIHRNDIIGLSHFWNEGK